MVIAILLAVLLVLVTFLFHFTVFMWLSRQLSRIQMSPSVRMLIIVLAILVAHLFEISLYAVAYKVGDNMFAIGSFSGISVSRPLDYFYFSIVSYTSLGLGDVYPSGHLRFITGVEALNGLLLIAWSGSFIYLAMGRLWPWEICGDPVRPQDPV